MLTPADVAPSRAAGADAVLVGEALVPSDPVAPLRSFKAAGAGDEASDREEEG